MHAPRAPAGRARCCALLLLALLLTACSGSRAVTIVDGWIERPDADAMAYAYLRVHNDLSQTVRLVGVRIAGIEAVRFVATASAHPVADITIEAGKTLRMPDEGYRIEVGGDAVDWETVDHLDIQLAVEQADGQLLPLSYALHIHDHGDGHHEDGHTH